MVAQTKAETGRITSKPDQVAKMGVQQNAVADRDNALDDPATAAAVVDVEKAKAAAQSTDSGVMPTEAPVLSIGDMAQVSEPTTTDATTGATAETTPPPVAEDADAVSPWLLGGGAALGVLGIVAIADDDDDDDDDDSPAPAPAPEPGPAPAPAPEPPPPPPPPPSNAAPTSSDSGPVALDADGSTALSAANFPFSDTDTGDVLTSVKIGTITATAIDTATDPQLEIDPAAGGHGYELVEGIVTWDQAKAAAEAKGGYLAILNTEAEASFLKASFDLGAGSVTANGNLQTDGAWVGASQAPNSTALGSGWSWVDGSALPADSPFWVGAGAPVAAPQDFRQDPDTFGTEDGEAQYAAIFETFGGPGVATPSIMYDFGETNASGAAVDSASRYLIEYDNPNAPLTLNGAPVVAGQDIAAADLGALQWNSVFNSGGTVTYTVSDGEASSSPENTLTLAAAPAAATNIGISIEVPDSTVLG